MLTKADREEKRGLLLALVDAVAGVATAVALTSPDHGPRHWRDVARVAHALWAEGMEADPIALLIFALMHDSQRLNEYDDPDHGRRAAAVLGGVPFRSPLIDKLIDQEQRLGVELAMSIHNGGDTAADPLIATCLDADRLTLGRVGIVPDPKLLSTDFAKTKEFRKLGREIIESNDETWETIIDAYLGDAPLDTRVSVLHDRPRDGNNTYAYMQRMLRGGELCEELQECVVDDVGVLGQWIMHPLCHEPFVPGTEAHLNERLEFKRKLIQDALDQGNWYGAILHHERPYRVAIFEQLIAWRIDDDDEWWEVVSHIWTDSENIWQEVGRWRSLLTGAPAGDPMNDEERKVFDALPDEITVYRGVAAPDGMGSGMSWTLDREKAIWFAKRFALEGGPFGETPKLLTGVVDKEEAIGYQSGRGEQEIVALPEHVNVTNVEALSTKSVDNTESGGLKKIEEEAAK